jgi:flagellum-specific ATP synthase
MTDVIHLGKYRDCLDAVCPIQSTGTVTNITGLVVESRGPVARLGTVCDIYTRGKQNKVVAEVLGFRNDRVLLMPLEEIRGIGPGCRVVARQQKALVPVGREMLGRVIDGLGQPIDGKGYVSPDHQYPIYTNAINPLRRKRIRRPLDLGIRALNGLLTVGCGQRMGVFAGSGVGKSVLLGMIARNTSADVNVIALIGERGREVNEFIEKDLGPQGLQRSVLVVATSDRLPLIRMRGAFLATAIAEFFRDQGMHVNLMMDSVTRFAMAQREIGLALGEPPTTKGYTPSVFTLLPKLLERAGTTDRRGTITGLYTVLVEGDDTNEPVADAVRSILDGHVLLSRDLAMLNHYPAIDVMGSISRVMDDIVAPEHKRWSGLLKETLAVYRKAEDLINIGAYVTGSNPKIDFAMQMIDRINAYLRQDIETRISLEESIAQLDALFGEQAGPAESKGGTATVGSG